jgi:hypothetical protein
MRVSARLSDKQHPDRTVSRDEVRISGKPDLR